MVGETVSVSVTWVVCSVLGAHLGVAVCTSPKSGGVLFSEAVETYSV